MIEPGKIEAAGRIINLIDAVGSVIAHDITEIVPGKFKGPAFKKGHVVREEDLKILARIGKEHLFVLDIEDGMLHEDDAALAMAEALAGEGVTFGTDPCEGKITLVAERDGLLKVNENALIEFNMHEGIMCASRHTNTLVKKGDKIAGTRAIPLVIARETVESACSLAEKGNGVFSVQSLAKPKVGIVITGNEVYSGLIEDKFLPAMKPKLDELECPILDTVFAPDDKDFVAESIKKLLTRGAEMIITTGGMSVDPDDITRAGVLAAGASNLLYGAPVLPGAMLMLADINGVPIIGVPACGMFHDITVFDLVLPRILAGEEITRRDMAKLGHGGFCLGCDECKYPVCPFGK